MEKNPQKARMRESVRNYISQPSTVTRVLMLAELSPGHGLLEIGFGSGWNARLIAYLVYPGKVASAETVPELGGETGCRLN